MVLTSHCAQVGVTYFFTKTSNIDFTLECIWATFFLKVRCRRRKINYRRLFLNFAWNVKLNLEQQYLRGFIFTRLADRWVNDYASFWNNTDRGKSGVLGEKPVTSAILFTSIRTGLACDRNRAFAMRGRRLTTWATARHAAMLCNEASPRTVSLNRSYPVGDFSVLVTAQFAPKGCSFVGAHFKT
jgi:hypothetical protein